MSTNETQCLREYALFVNGVIAQEITTIIHYRLRVSIINGNFQDNMALFSSLFVQRVKKLLGESGYAMSGKTARFHCKYLCE